ncbi:MAG: phosphoglucomutase/phosphomannomutase family protein, partial [Candidatus Acidiferrales bacterium]
DEERARVAARIKKTPAKFDGRRVARVDRTDGLKLLFEDDSWVLLRLSGTEPVVRCYCEAHSQQETQALVEAAQKFIAE